MTTAVKYIILEGRDRFTFTNNVNTHLDEGWQLYGSSTTTTVVLGHNTVTTYFQALTHTK